MNPYLDASKTTKKAWPQTGLPPLDDFYREMTEGLPEGTRLHVETTRTGRLKKLSYEFGEVGDPGEKYFYFNRVFSRSGRCVEHDEDKVGHKLQRKGINRTVNAHVFRLNERIGITSAFLLAQGVGAYTQAKLGFYPDRTAVGELAPRMSDFIDWLEAHPPKGQPRLPKHFVNALRRWDERGDGRDFWFLADQALPYRGMPLGKLLTVSANHLPQDVRAAVHETGGPLDEHEWMSAVRLASPDVQVRRRAYLHGEGHGKDHSIKVARRLGLDRDDIVNFMGVEPPRRRGVVAIPATLAP
jgi:hypothetical protein